MCRWIASTVVLLALVLVLLGCSSTTDPGGVDEPLGVDDCFAMTPGDWFQFDVDWYEEGRDTDITGEYTVTCLGYEEHSGHQCLEVSEVYDLTLDNGDSTWTDGYSDTSYFRLTDTQVLWYFGGSEEAVVALQEPLTAGATWTSGGSTVELSSTDVTVNVPAGSFAGCLAIGELGESPSMFWSPQVGFLVRMLAGGEDWEHLTELASYGQ